MDCLTIAVFALALNADSFSAGIAYGVKRIRLPFPAVLVISAMSAGAITASMFFGHLISPFFGSDFSHRLGGILLLILGAWFFYQATKPPDQSGETFEISETAGTGRPVTDLPVIDKPLTDRLGIDQPVTDDPVTAQPVLRFKIKLGSLIIQILSKPQCADLDSSGDISLSEAVVLGFALAMDSFSAGFAVSMFGFSIPFTAAAVGLGHILLIYPGLWLGRLAGKFKIFSRAAIFPGCILMLLGLYKILS